MLTIDVSAGMSASGSQDLMSTPYTLRTRPKNASPIAAMYAVSTWLWAASVSSEPLGMSGYLLAKNAAFEVSWFAS